MAKKKVTFKALLKRAGMTKAALAKELKINPRTPSSWGEDPPGYAVAYVKQRIELNRYRP